MKYNTKLKQLLDSSVERMKADPDVLAGYVLGSAGTSDEDEYSDIDAVFVVRSQAFERIANSVADFFASMCDSVEVVWAERFNTSEHHNYAVLLKIGESLLQYDISIDTEDFRPERKVLRSQVLFDKTGYLKIVEQLPRQEINAELLRWHIEAYWIWIYIHAKYLSRMDYIKLVYVQQELFNNHIMVLRNLYEESRPFTWWPQAVKALPDQAKGKWMMNYLSHPDINSVLDKLPGQIEVFGADARDLCESLNIAYPHRLESVVTEHLYKSVPVLRK